VQGGASVTRKFAYDATIARVTELLEITKPTATRAVNTLVDASILTETTRRRRDRTYSYAAYLERLRVGTELEG
jgi:predicted transcriptional regulator